jgi:hypothetical protein
MDIKQLTSNLDEYTIKARLEPALLVALPLLFATLTLFPEGFTGFSAIASLFVWAGGSVLLSQIGREWGKRKEPDLYQEWGGQPSVRLLRHRDAPNIHVLARRHAKLEKLLPDLKIPTVEEERADHQHADKIYDACCAFLRAKTRDKKAFFLVFEENINYGFRRNLWGMRPLGIVASVAGLMVIGLAALIYSRGEATIPKVLWLYGAINLLLLSAWIFIFNKNWVKTAADAYATRLLESTDSL